MRYLFLIFIFLGISNFSAKEIFKASEKEEISISGQGCINLLYAGHDLIEETDQEENEEGGDSSGGRGDFYSLNFVVRNTFFALAPKTRSLILFRSGRIYLLLECMLRI